MSEEKKEIKWQGVKLMVGDTVIGTVENCKFVDTNDLPETYELNKPIEYGCKTDFVKIRPIK